MSVHRISVKTVNTWFSYLPVPSTRPTVVRNGTMCTTIWIKYTFCLLPKMPPFPLLRKTTIRKLPNKHRPPGRPRNPKQRKSIRKMNTTIRISPTGLSNYQSQQEITTICIWSVIRFISTVMVIPVYITWKTGRKQIWIAGSFSVRVMKKQLHNQAGLFRSSTSLVPR